MQRTESSENRFESAEASAANGALLLESAGRRTWDPEIESVARRNAARRMKPILTYMLENLNKPLTASMLSTLAGVSASSFYSMFKCATGFSPIDFFIRARMQRACDLLQENANLSVKEIAAVLGYGDPYYFSRLFKSVIGVSPSGYRASFLEVNCPECRGAETHPAKPSRSLPPPFPVAGGSRSLETLRLEPPPVPMPAGIGVRMTFAPSASENPKPHERNQ